MFGPLGAMEILFILVLALLIFGPRRLPEVGRTIGKALGEFRRATTDLKRTVNTELALEEDEERPTSRRRPAALAATGTEAEGIDSPAMVRPVAGAHPRSPLRQPAVGGDVTAAGPATADPAPPSDEEGAEEALAGRGDGG